MATFPQMYREHSKSLKGTEYPILCLTSVETTHSIEASPPTAPVETKGHPSLIIDVIMMYASFR